MNSISLAHDWGKQDGLEGVGRQGSVYFCFDTPDYAAYDEGHAAGQAQRNQLEGNPWSEGYEAGKTGSEYDNGRCHVWKEGYCGGRIITQRLSGQKVSASVESRPRTRLRNEVRRLSGGSEQPKPHRKYQEGRDLDQDLFELRNGVTEPIIRYTDEMMEEIEAERF